MTETQSQLRDLQGEIGQVICKLRSNLKKKKKSPNTEQYAKKFPWSQTISNFSKLTFFFLSLFASSKCKPLARCSFASQQHKHILIGQTDTAKLDWLVEHPWKMCICRSCFFKVQGLHSPLCPKKTTLLFLKANINLQAPLAYLTNANVKNVSMSVQDVPHLLPCDSRYSLQNKCDLGEENVWIWHLHKYHNKNIERVCPSKSKTSGKVIKN